MENLISASEAARRLGLVPQTLSRWLREGRVPRAVKVANMWLVPDDLHLEEIDTPEMGRPPKANGNGNGEEEENVQGI